MPLTNATTKDAVKMVWNAATRIARTRRTQRTRKRNIILKMKLVLQPVIVATPLLVWALNGDHPGL